MADSHVLKEVIIEKMQFRMLVGTYNNVKVKCISVAIGLQSL